MAIRLLPRTLRRRLALVLIVLTVGAGALFLASAATVYLWLERAMLDDVLEREIEVYTKSGASPAEIVSAGGRIRLYRPSIDGRAPPTVLASLAPGSYLDVDLGEGQFHVLVRDVGPGDRCWLLYNVDIFEAHEQRALEFLLTGIAAAALLSWLLGGWAARQTLEPLRSLVDRIGLLRGDPDERLPSTQGDGELTVIVAAVNGLLSQVQALVDRERAFAGAAAHELRTPLTSMRLATEVLATADSEPREPLLRIARAVRSASQDLDALLALSRSRQLPAAEVVRLHELLPLLAASNELHDGDGASRIRWRLQPVEAKLPVGVLSVIFGNLLRNAQRAAPQGEVVVELSPGLLQVIDDGCGIPAELLPHVFEPGSRGADGGSGIGLYIARTLADRCGWNLSIGNREGSGTVARLEFSQPLG